MRITDILKNRQRTEIENNYCVTGGKASDHVLSSVFIFAPVAFVISCLLIIITVIGLPSAMELLKTSYNSVFNVVQMHEAAPELLFSDVRSDSKYYDSLAFLKKNGIIDGYDDNSFKPDQEMSRAEFLKLLINSKRKFPLLLNYNSCFKDVKTEWYAPSVCLAKDKGWIKGLPDETFHPHESLNKAESLKILIEAFGIKKVSEGELESFSDVSKDSWYFNYVQIALDNGLINENVETDLFNPEAKITRGDVSQLLYRALLLQ